MFRSTQTGEQKRSRQEFWSGVNKLKTEISPLVRKQAISYRQIADILHYSMVGDSNPHFSNVSLRYIR